MLGFALPLCAYCWTSSPAWPHGTHMYSMENNYQIKEIQHKRLTSSVYFKKNNQTSNRIFYKRKINIVVLQSSRLHWVSNKPQKKKFQQNHKPEFYFWQKHWDSPLKDKQNYLHMTKMLQAFLISILAEKQSIKNSHIFDLSCLFWERKPFWQKGGKKTPTTALSQACNKVWF